MGIKEKDDLGEKTDHRHISLNKIVNMTLNVIIYSILKIETEILQHHIFISKMSK